MMHSTQLSCKCWPCTRVLAEIGTVQGVKLSDWQGYTFVVCSISTVCALF